MLLVESTSLFQMYPYFGENSNPVKTVFSLLLLFGFRQVRHDIILPWRCAPSNIDNHPWSLPKMRMETEMENGDGARTRGS